MEWNHWRRHWTILEFSSRFRRPKTSSSSGFRFRFRRRLFDRFTWNTFANIITYTHIYIVIYREPIPSPKIEGRQPVSPAATGGNMSCHNDNSGCHQRQPSRQIDDPPSSMIVDEIGSHRSSKLCVILSDILWKHMQCIPRKQFRHWKTKSRHDATLPPLAASEAVILTTCDATSDDKISTTATLGPQRTYFVWIYLLRQICR